MVSFGRSGFVFAALAAACVVGVPALAAGAAPGADSPQLDPIYVDGMAGGDGVYGYLLEDATGSVLLSRNSAFVYDPASALKTLLLVYALREIGGGRDSLSRSVIVYRYPNSRNANGNPESANLCPDTADERAENAVTPAPDLQTVLSGMMRASDNRYTRAVELRYGREQLNGFARSLGMANTTIDQVFGCGDDGGRHNTWTLDDGALLYKAIVDERTLNEPTTRLLYATMLGAPSGFASHVTTVIASEAARLEIPGAVAPFASGVVLHLKGGSYDICRGTCATFDRVTRDVAGIADLPVQTSTDVRPRRYVWGSFIANETTSCSTFPCSGADRADAAVNSALPELLRPAIADALRTWTKPTSLRALTGRLGGGKLRLRATLVTTYGNRAIAGTTIRFVIRGTTVCSSATDRTGTAHCVSTVRPPATTFSVRFAGTADQYPAMASGRVIRP